MAINSRQLGKELKAALHKMWWHVRLLRAYNVNRDETICGVQHHKFIFDRMIESFVNFLIIELCAVTDVNNRRGATFTIWLQQLIDAEVDSDDKNLLLNQKSTYDIFCSSPEYQGIKTRRDKAYAHRDQDRQSAFTLPGNTYGDLFGGVEKLMNIYDAVASIGEADITNWSGPPDADLYTTVGNNADTTPEELLIELMHSLENQAHQEKWHIDLNQRSPSR